MTIHPHEGNRTDEERTSHFPPQSDPQWLLIYFGTDWNPENRTSVHHVARGLGARHQVLYFECPGLRAPSGNSRDIGRVWRKLQAGFARPRHPMPNVTVRTLLQLPFHRLPFVTSLNRWLLGMQVRRALRQAPSIRPRISWFVAPHVAALAGQLGEDLIVYYCVDDFASFPGVDMAAVRAWDTALTMQANLVFVASATLIDRKAAIATRVLHAPHGVDVEHFATARNAPTTRPSDLPVAGPIVGFFGLIAEWIDVELVARLAARHPEWQFVLIGRVAIPDGSLPRRPNIHYLGQRPYERLPEYGAWFDVAIIPYILTEQVLHANPIKLREYLAMAKPIVTVSTPEIDVFADAVTIVHNDVEWEQAITDALAETDPGMRQARQIALAAEMSWQARLDAVETSVRQALRARP